MDNTVLNSAKFRGVIVSDPVFKKQCQSSNSPKLSFMLKAGVPGDEKLYALVPCSIWGQLAIDMRDRLTKKTTVRVEGSVGTWKLRDSEGKNPRPRWALNITAAEVLTRTTKPA